MNGAGGRPNGRRSTAAAGLLLAAALTTGCNAANPAAHQDPKSLPATPAKASATPTRAPRAINTADLLSATLSNDQIEPAGSTEKKVSKRNAEWAPTSISNPDCVPFIDPYRYKPQLPEVIQTFGSKEAYDWGAATTLTAHPSPADAAEELAELRKAVQGCREFHIRGIASGNGSGTRMILNAVQAPARGDDALAYNRTSWTDVSDINPDTAETRTIERFTVVRVGSVIAEFRLSPSDSVEAMQFPAELMTLQIQRLHDLR
ncbi:hypothetical protein [Streptomyces sp. NPDC089799]|uniref:hypothetical protein n=1 Tax=Streptomyces sp. NPDC089799 TaxID=3155066 RepID=UPI003436AE7D